MLPLNEKIPIEIAVTQFTNLNPYDEKTRRLMSGILSQVLSLLSEFDSFKV